MSAPRDDLTRFALGIVRGQDVPDGMLSGNANYSAATAIGIYRNNYRGNLHDALAGTYPVMEQLVGTDFFRHMTRHYIGLHPSCSGNLHHYGAVMAAFVASFEPARQLPYLPDIAELEWACHCAYFADDTTTLDLAGLARIPAGRYSDLVLSVHAACQLVHSRYPIAAIWHAHQPGAGREFHIDLDSGGCIAMISRKDDVVRVGELAAADAAWLQGILAQATLGEATAATLEHYPDFDLLAVLTSMVAQDVIIGFNLRDVS